MKKILFKITGVVVMFGMLLTSCTKDFEEINTNPNNIPDVLPQQLLAPALVSTMRYNQIRNRNFNNELMQVTVDMSDADGKVFRYDYRSTWSDYLYNGWYSELANFRDIYNVASEELNYNKSYIGISLVCQSWIYSMLTDTYGDIPYRQALQGRDSAVYEPQFDKQEDIYFDIFSKLEQANSLLASNTGINGNSDPVYHGDIAKWRKFSNSLYLRLLLRISGKAAVTDTCVKKIQEILETKTGTYPIISSNEEAAFLEWNGGGPYTSPLMTIREQDYRSPAICSFFIDHLATWDDPRIDIPTYGTSNINRWCIAPSSGAYVGVPSGYVTGETPTKRSYFYSTSSARTLMNDPYTGIIMNYAEILFIKAEAAVKGWIGGNAEDYYKDGIINSIKYWLPDYDLTADEYIIKADLQWNESGSLDDKMEQIHLQKYYALFLVDMQQWFEYRRTGHPALPKGQGLRNDGVMPARMTYPVYIQSTNPTNYKAAVAEQGPDNISTQVWWQKP
ncbi:SusD/RagB family nutrient-binding outer membrane lipoprotein [Chitinophaga caeni]|uniref:SusD/RagB family nutrient-binding outer membrane lipoprotein n=1 Tax=Chitinophaga caeni TaxID=2029983 RepID=A0A291QYY9_9BACT|nr:SusD/RagB family nutrient-binding outer membrane lipoprotein [Chitinophaga caeni]ATL49196.1 SusD/RagB family nutrient-binding outer membrane lipoprotein [Chitinophaga caeni]